jgi:hypothetical protein
VLFTADSGQGSPPAGVVAHLQYREVDFAPLACEIEVHRGARFTKEPAFSGPDVFRGSFCLGPDTNLFLPFAWDARAHRLYLDLNRNRDLTDDPAGVIAATDRRGELYRGLPLEFPSPDGPYRILVDAHVLASREAPRVILLVRSLWEGTVELSGKQWYVAVIGKPDGRLGPAASLEDINSRLILRPWAERDKPFLWWHATLPYAQSLDLVKLVTPAHRCAANAEVFDAFNLPAKLFLQDQTYRLSCRVEPGGAPAGLALSFEPVRAVLGRVRVDGDFIRRIVLDGSGAPDQFTAVVDAPGAEVQVPVGVYGRQIVRLQCDGGTNIAIGLGANRVAVTETNAAIFNAGGPLRQTVEVGDAASGIASLQYRLANAAGLRFRVAFHNEKAPPQLVIRQRDTLVEEGRFRFG